MKYLLSIAALMLALPAFADGTCKIKFITTTAEDSKPLMLSFASALEDEAAEIECENLAQKLAGYGLTGHGPKVQKDKKGSAVLEVESFFTAESILEPVIKRTKTKNSKETHTNGGL